KPLTILEEREHRIVHRLRHWNAAAHAGRVAPFGENPVRARVDRSLLEQQAQRDTSPLAARHEPVGLADGEVRRRRLVQALAVPGALEEVDARDHRIAQQSIDGEDQRALHQAMDQQAMPAGIDLRYAAVVTLEVQAAGRDHAVERLEWRTRRSTAR